MNGHGHLFAGFRLVALLILQQLLESENLDQMQAADTATLTSANAYTDQRIGKVLGLADDFNAFRGDVERRFCAVDARIDRSGALSGALSGMAMNSANLGGRNRMAMGIGAQGGREAIALGYQRAIGNRASVSLGAAFSGSESTVSGGADSAGSNSQAVFRCLTVVTIPEARRALGFFVAFALYLLH